jgi:hypothetical protein
LLPKARLLVVPEISWVDQLQDPRLSTTLYLNISCAKKKDISESLVIADYVQHRGSVKISTYKPKVITVILRIIFPHLPSTIST